MPKRTPHLPFVLLLLLLLATLTLTPTRAAALGFILGQSKGELKLKYDVTIHDPNTGRVIIEFTLQDDGRLKPVDAIELMIPTEDHTGGVDLALTLAVRDENGKRHARAEIKKEWAARAEIWLTTYTFDGKRDPTTRRHHIIHLAPHVRPKPAPAAKPATPPAPERKQN